MSYLRLWLLSLDICGGSVLLSIGSTRLALSGG
jgi:hypothetical protein